jgi:hypothetical protein
MRASRKGATMKRLLITLLCATALAVGTSSQEKPLKLSDLTTVEGPLTFVEAPNHIILTCQSVPTSSSYQPEDFYDCKLENGTTLDGLIRFVMRQQRVEREQWQAERKAIMDAWQKSLPKPVSQDKKGRS